MLCSTPITLSCSAPCCPAAPSCKLGRCSLQRKHFSSDGRLQLLRCSCPLSALLLRLVSVIDHSGGAMAQHDRHKLVARIMKRYFSAVAHRLWDKQGF